MVRRSKSRRRSRKSHGGGITETVKRFQDVVNDNFKIDTDNAGYCDADCTPHVYYDQDPNFKQLGGRRHRKNKKSLRGGDGQFVPLQMHPSLLNFATPGHLKLYGDSLKKWNANPLMRAELHGGRRHRHKTGKKTSKKKSKKSRRLH